MDLVINEKRLRMKEMRALNLDHFRALYYDFQPNGPGQSDAPPAQAGTPKGAMKKNAKRKAKPHDPVTWILDCYKAEDWHGTLSELDQGLAGDSVNPALLWLRADVKARMGHATDACKDLETAIGKSEHNVDILFTWAEILRVPMQAPQKAIAVYDLIESLSTSGVEAQLYHARAAAHIHMQQYQQAQRDLEQCLGSEWDGSRPLPGAHQDLAHMMILNREYEAACNALMGASKSSGDMPDQRCVALATALYGQGKQEKALQKLDQACKISPANVTALKNRATVKGALGPWNECLLDMRQCVLLEPQNQTLQDRMLDLMAFADDSHDIDVIKLSKLLPAPAEIGVLQKMEPISQLHSTRTLKALGHTSFWKQPLFQRTAPRIPRPQPQRARGRSVGKACASAAASQPEAVPLQDAQGRPARFPEAAGVYAVYSKDLKLQYVGMSRKISSSIEKHAKEVPHLVHSVKAGAVPQASRDQLIAEWKSWIQEAVNESGQIPPGNGQEKELWSAKRVKPELKLTPGKGIQDLTVPLETLIDQVVKNTKVVAFIKGTRQQPQCGFSFKVLSILNDNKADYEAINVLDEQYNPGLRETLKTYSQWPTIPQLYVNGELLGGADIVEEMQQSGELQKALTT
ncbi:hypothetical protein WJX84_000381 [Apatococcus fuscideae]|uniref:Glutaredoxin domain-containing protein n=1 Tax=Apatococcus fuscideae TaxID=2026836 RepID=A0AAW1SFL7_9CHLO